MAQVRVVEVLAALSLTTDIASGVPLEKGLRTCAVATAFGRELGLAQDELATVFHTALLRAIGCTSHASENAAQFGDDIAFQAWLKEIDFGDEAALGRQLRRFAHWAEESKRPALVADFIATAPTVGPRANLAACEVGRALGPRLGLPSAAVLALDNVYERWDGKGIPGVRAGDDLPIASRIVHLAEQAVLVAAEGGGLEAVVAEIRHRSGGHLDPDLVTAFAAAPEPALAPLAERDILAAVIAAEPGTVSMAGDDVVLQMCRALACVVDLKGKYLLGHSDHVATIARTAARLAGLDSDAQNQIETAGLLHDIGRAGVPSSVWDLPGPLTDADWERVRLHTYWTSRVLERCPALASLAPLAASHHEHLDGSGYHRGCRATELDFTQRLLAAADALAELTEPRPERAAMRLPDAAAQLEDHAREGRLDPRAVSAVVEAAGLPRRRPPLPNDLSEREVDVLRLVARGMTNQQIADELVLSPRTVGNHLARVYDKIGRRSRAGAAVFAIEHGLVLGVD
ncbi:MAG TPA: HD domain-containing phosphohydrolase [Mycobacteriales bacterium]|nr:HD domain-containing phosphohydrolase [Mycobacteriales bacterium]